MVIITRIITRTWWFENRGKSSPIETPFFRFVKRVARRSLNRMWRHILVDDPDTEFSSLRSKRFRGAWEQRTGLLALCPRGKWGESQKWNMGVGEGKEGNACIQTPGFWKPPSASERNSWLAGLVENYWKVSIKGLSPLGAREKWNWYVYKERSLFSPNEDFVMSFDNTVEIL